MEIRLLESAKDDLREGWTFYEQQAAGIGNYFLDSIHADVQSLRLYAGIHERPKAFIGCSPSGFLSHSIT